MIQEIARRENYFINKKHLRACWEQAECCLDPATLVLGESVKLSGNTYFLFCFSICFTCLQSEQ